MHWYTDVLKKYAVFDGRAARPEYWWFTLFSTIVAIVIGVVVAVAVSGGSGQVAADLYSLAVLLPSLGVTIRRLHDTNRSGWWILISLIPFVGWVWLIVLLCIASDSGPNRFGQGPSGGQAPRYDTQARYDTHTGEPLAPPPTDAPY